MKPLDQRQNECSLCSVCTLNGLSQKDYEAVSDLAKEAGATYGKHSSSTYEDIAIGLRTCIGLGLVLPSGYAAGPGNYPCPPSNSSITSPDFSGRGILRVVFLPKRCRKYRAHVAAFENGKIYDSDGRMYPGWISYHKSLRFAGNRQIRITNIFRA